MKYNLHCLLWDMFHVKSKLLCKLGYHNFMLGYKVKVFHVEHIEKPYCKIVEHKKDYTLYYQCHCCGTEREIIDENTN